MVPFVDNRHVAEGHPEQTPRYRVQFKGTHNLKILVRTEHKNEVTIGAHPCPPMYKFLNESGKSIQLEKARDLTDVQFRLPGVPTTSS
jgi:hypothetical protein